MTGFAKTNETDMIHWTKLDICESKLFQMQKKSRIKMTAVTQKWHNPLPEFLRNSLYEKNYFYIMISFIYIDSSR